MAELVRPARCATWPLGSRPETLRRAHAVHPITALQSEYSLWTRDLEGDILDAAANSASPSSPYSPLGRGFLTGRFRSEEDVRAANDSRASRYPRFLGDNFRRNMAIVERLEAIAVEKGVTAGQLALAWVLHQGGDIVPIPGTKRVDYVEQNVAAATLRLSAEDLTRMDEAAPPGATAGDRYVDMSTVNG